MEPSTASGAERNAAGPPEPYAVLVGDLYLEHEPGGDMVIEWDSKGEATLTLPQRTSKATPGQVDRGSVRDEDVDRILEKLRDI